MDAGQSRVIEQREHLNLQILAQLRNPQKFCSTKISRYKYIQTSQYTITCTCYTEFHNMKTIIQVTVCLSHADSGELEDTTAKRHTISRLYVYSRTTQSSNDKLKHLSNHSIQGDSKEVVTKS